MHCADICLSATHNESARKLVMTQFEPCQYRHKSRYDSVLQNRCFYTYIWLAYLVRFFERLLRQTTPKLLPLFECLPLLFLLMSLRYSGRNFCCYRLQILAIWSLRLFGARHKQQRINYAVSAPGLSDCPFKTLAH